MHRVRLVHWNPAEAEERRERLRSAGFVAEVSPPHAPEFVRELSSDPPDAVVIDLGRLPSHGRDIALALRERKATRGLPLVFVDGEATKVERVRRVLPDAVFTTWARIRTDLARAIAHPPRDPHVPSSRMDGYSGRPLAAKLGIKPDCVVGSIGAPKDFVGSLGELPDGAKLRAGARGRCDLIVWFVREVSELERRIETLAAREDFRGVWIAWQKKTANPSATFGDKEVRAAALAAGLVDYKVCAIDATWSGLLFARRKR